MAISKTNAADAIPQVWLGRAIGVLSANLVMGALVRRDADNEVANVGDTINVIKRGALTVRDKAEDTDVTADAPDNTKVAVVLDKHKYVAWHVEDEASATAVADGLNYVSDAAVQLAEAIETDLLALHADVATAIGTAGTDLTKSTIIGARKALNDQKCPQMMRNLIVSTKDDAALLAIDDFVRADARGDDGTALEQARLGRLYGMDTYMSQLVDVTSGSPDTTHNIAFHPAAFMLAMRPLPLPRPGSGAIGTYIVDPVSGVAMRYTIQWDSDALKMKHVLDVLYGVRSIDEDRLAVVVNG